MDNIFFSPLIERWNLVEQRCFSDEEIKAVKSNIVVNSKLGKSVCFFMNRGGQCYIPLRENAEIIALGSSIDMKKVKLVTLHRDGDGNVLRVDIPNSY